MPPKFAGIGRVDHIAIAVKSIDEAIHLYSGLLGFDVVMKREVKGAFSGMKSVELNAGGFGIVLVEGTDPNSQVSRYIEKYGPGVQHVAIEVENIEAAAREMQLSGVKFATSLIRGNGLLQIFTERDANCGMMFEFIQRQNGVEGFEEGNIQELFTQLELSEAY